MDELEAARFLREAEAKVRAKISAEQKGELFANIEGELNETNLTNQGNEGPRQRHR